MNEFCSYKLTQFVYNLFDSLNIILFLLWMLEKCKIVLLAWFLLYRLFKKRKKNGNLHSTQVHL